MEINPINVNCTFKTQKRSQKVKGAQEGSIPNMVLFKMRIK